MLNLGPSRKFSSTVSRTNLTSLRSKEWQSYLEKSVRPSAEGALQSWAIELFLHISLANQFCRVVTTNQKWELRSGNPAILLPQPCGSQRNPKISLDSPHIKTRTKLTSLRSKEWQSYLEKSVRQSAAGAVQSWAIELFLHISLANRFLCPCMVTRNECCLHLSLEIRTFRKLGSQFCYTRNWEE